MEDEGSREGSRQRRSHKKSRRGCRNCKLRRVKCDETRPKCQQCTAFGVSCNYDPSAPDLQMSFDGLATIKSLQKPPRSSHQAIPGVPACLDLAMVISDNDSSFKLDRQSLDRLGRFHMRTILSVGTERAARLYQGVTIELACSHPCLMHVVQTITAIHDRYLSKSLNSRQTVTELYHLSQAAVLFNRKLSKPIQPHDRDALWATAALLGTIAFSWIDALRPEEAWPLKDSDPSDLEWIDLSKNKTAIWNLTNPSRPDSVFYTLSQEYQNGHLHFAAAKPGMEGIPSEFIQLCGLDTASTADSSPYYTAVRVLAPLLGMECEQSTIVHFLSFISYMDPSFRKLLEQKDSRALLLLAYWHAKVGRSVWWMEWRALVECQAICLYLERYHAGETAIQEMLLFPKMRCGLIS